MTKYVVLAEADGDWSVLEDVDADSARAAIRAATNAPGVFVAVPARSWHPVTVTVETQTRMVLT